MDFRKATQRDEGARRRIGARREDELKEREEDKGEEVTDKEAGGGATRWHGGGR